MHYIYCIFIFVGLTFSPWELGSLSLYYKLYDTVYIFLFVCKSIFFVWINKRGSVWQLWTKVYLLNRDNNISLTYLNSTLETGWSTAGVADSNLTKVFLL